MKKTVLLLLLFISTITQAQTIPQNSRLAITKNVKQNSATRIVVQDSITKELNWVLKSSIASPTPTLQQVASLGAITTTSLTANGFIKSGGVGANVLLDNGTTAPLPTPVDISGKENTSNKSSSFTASSTTTYPDTKALVDGLATKQVAGSYLTAVPTLQQITAAGATTNIPVTFSTTGTAISVSSGSTAIIAYSNQESAVLAVSNNANAIDTFSTNASGLTAHSMNGVGSQSISQKGTALIADIITIDNLKNIAEFKKMGDVKVAIQNNGKITATAGTAPTDVVVKSQLDAVVGLPAHLEQNITDRTLWNNGKTNIDTNTTFGFESMINSTGGINTAFGYQALKANTSGQRNSSFGSSNMLSNTSGQQNSSFGQFALFSNTTGSDNTAIGGGALAFNVSGNENTALGRFAGAGVGTSIKALDNGIYIGFLAIPLANNQTNEIVIGHRATGAGSNTTTLGNTFTTSTIIGGLVTSPSTTNDLIDAGSAKTLVTREYVKKISVSKIAASTTLSESDNGKVILLTASCTVTIPAGLSAGFNCSFATQSGAILTYTLDSGVTLLNNSGTTMAPLSSHTLVNTGVTNEYLTIGL